MKTASGDASKSQRARLLSLMVGVMILGIVGMSGLIDNYVLADFKRLEETQVRGNLRLINLWLDRFLQPLEAQVGQASGWDETQRSLSGSNTGPIEARLRRLLETDARFDLAALVNADGALVYRTGFDPDTRAATALPAETVTPLLKHVAAWKTAGQPSNSGWSALEGGLMASAAHSIAAAPGRPDRGLLILAHHFPNEELRALEDLSGVLVSTTRFETGETGYERSSTLGEWRRGGTGREGLTLCTRLTAGQESDNSLLCVRLRESIYLRGKASIDDLRLTAMAGFIALITAVWLFMDRVLLRRLVRLTQHLLTTQEDDTVKLEQVLINDSAERDELGQLSGGMGRLLRRVRHAENHLREQEHSLRQMAQNLEYHASHDELTKLINRREFGHRVNEALEHRSTNRAPSALCYLDLDQFKLINDTAGHHAGDLMLQQIAQALSLRVRAGDSLARLGGDEFGLLLRDCPSDQAVVVADKMRNVISEQRVQWGERTFSVDASVGIAMLDQVEGGINEAMAAADAACFLAKDLGRNRVHLFKPGDADLQQQIGQMRWAQRLKDAMEHGRFRLFKQGIHRLGEKGPLRACEILLRMQENDGQLISAGEFLDAAARYQMMVALDRWVMGQAIEHIRAELRGPDRGMRYFINLSGPGLSDEGVRNFLLAQTAQHPELVSRLVIEVTETAVITNLSRAYVLIRQLRERGVEFALDDFGTGMASFLYLKELPVQYLKIAGQFVRNMRHNSMDEAVVRSFTGFAKMLRMETIAEWVEDEETGEALRLMGVGYAQGFHYDQPSPLLTDVSARSGAAAA